MVVHQVLKIAHCNLWKESTATSLLQERDTELRKRYAPRELLGEAATQENKATKTVV